MEKTGYDRYGLSSNPFRDLSSESLENVDIFHVSQNIDDELSVLKEEIFDKENKAVVAVLGDYGFGKTERLLLAANEAKKNKAFYVIVNMSAETKWSVANVIDQMIKNSGLTFFQRTFSSPKWYRNLLKMKKQVKKRYNPDAIGRVIVEALNANAPSFLLLNDLHNLSHVEDLDNFVRVLHNIADYSNHGVLTMMVSDANYFQNLMSRHPSMNQRINHEIIIPPLSNNEASLMIAKRMLEKRMVDSIEPLYPFTEEAIYVLNKEAKGRPRQLLQITSFVIDLAAQRKIMNIDKEITIELLNIGKNQRLNIMYQDETQIISPDQKLEKPVEIPISRKTNKEKKAKKSGLLPKKSKMSKSKQIPVYQGNPTSNPNNPGDDSSFLPDDKFETSIDNEFETMKEIDKPEVIKNVRVRCPKCTKIFNFEITNETEKLVCPNPDCDFSGKIPEKMKKK